MIFQIPRRPKPIVPALPYPVAAPFTWRPKGGKTNFGDELSSVVTMLMLAKRGITILDEVPDERQLMTIGSVLHFADDGATVWGSGVNGKIDASLHRFSKLDVRAVRGPKTRAFLEAKGIPCPEVFGDPALLLASLLKEQAIDKKFDAIFVPNLNDLSSIARGEHKIDMPIISPVQSWNRVLKDIRASRMVMASSLHGLILAEAFGIPAYYLRLSEHESLFKYEDYYAGTGRKLVEISSSVAGARQMEGDRDIVFDPEPLIDAFPYDIWEQALDRN